MNRRRPKRNPHTPRNRSRILLAALLLPLLLTLGCGEDETGDGTEPTEPTPTVQLHRSDLARETDPAVDPVDVEVLAEGITAFGVDLYHRLAGEGGNLFYSPYSLSQVMAMTWAGARTETRWQIERVFHFTLPGEVLHPAFNRLDQELAGRAVVETEEGPVEGFHINSARSVWAARTHPFLPAYLDLLARHYGAGLWRADFEGAPETVRGAINDWVSRETEGRIETLFSPGSISPATRLVIANALFFKAPWETPFDEEMTVEGTFRIPGGDSVPVPMMVQKEILGYLQGEGFQAVALPYLGEMLSMVILLPDGDDPAALEGRLTPEWLADALPGLTPEVIRIHLPRFSFQSASISLAETLSAMGMPVAFTDSANFSGMDGSTDLRISAVTHQASVSVDEEGTEASAGSGVIVGPTNPGDPLAVVTVDRPFLFLIRDIPTGAVLFMGRIIDPRG